VARARAIIDAFEKYKADHKERVAEMDPNAVLREEIRRREQNQDMHLNPWKWFSLDPREV